MSLTPSTRSNVSRLLLMTLAAVSFTACSKKDDPVVIVPPPPAPVATIVLSTSTIAFTDTTGTTSPAPVDVQITNSGTKALTGVAAGTVSYTSGTSGWLSASMSGADAPATMTLTANNAGLTAGTYTATVPVVSGVANNSPQNIQVTYQVSAPAGPPPPPTVSGPVVLAAGNIAQCGIGQSATTAALIESQPSSSIVLALGDNAFPRDTNAGAWTTPADFQDCYDPTWGRFKSRTWAAVGNREQAIDGYARGTDAYFGFERAGLPGRNWHAFDVGTWRIIVLNISSGSAVTYGNGSNQLDFLNAELAANAGRKCVMAVWHDPWMSSASTSTGIEHNTQRGVISALYNAGVDLVINGGRHWYERLAPLNASGAVDSAAGIRFINNGLGGDGPTTPAFTHPANEVLGIGRGVLKLVLGDGNYSWEFLPAAGTTLTDSGIGTCH